MALDNDPGESGGNPVSRLIESLKSGRAPLPLIGGLAAIVVIAIIFVAVIFGSGGGDDDDDSAAAGASPTVARSPTATSSSGGLQTTQPTPQATLDLSRPTGEAQNLTSVSEGDKMVIPSIGVDAPLTYRAVGTDGVMPNPDGPDDVAVYDFSAWPGLGGAPGLGGNFVTAGHVDSGSEPCENGTVQPPCQAVLWDLNFLAPGETIEVHVGGTVYTYEVTSNEPVSASEGPWDQIVASTAEETLTIITCGGDFNRETREYTNRQVVTAARRT